MSQENSKDKSASKAKTPDDVVEKDAAYPSADPDADARDEKNVENSAKDGDAWPLQADRMAIRMPLVDCLRMMAGHYGRRTSNAALVSGLPVPTNGITPSLFIRAAERADMVAHLAERSLESLAIAPNLPCIMTLEEGQACILWDIKYPKKAPPRKTIGEGGTQGPIEIHPKTRFLVQFPETPDDKRFVTLEELKNLYSGYAFFVRPVARVDDRAGPAEINTGRDWFWSAFWKNKTLYTEVAVAAIFINIFGIAGSLFIMNVYDRVVPNGEAALDTLWVLAAGILTVYFFDFMFPMII